VFRYILNEFESDVAARELDTFIGLTVKDLRCSFSEFRHSNGCSILHELVRVLGSN
jgi:hypothetical protein